MSFSYSAEEVRCKIDRVFAFNLAKVDIIYTRIKSILIIRTHSYFNRVHSVKLDNHINIISQKSSLQIAHQI